MDPYSTEAEENINRLRATGLPVIDSRVSLTCAYPACPRDKATTELMICSACRTRRYCSLTCQKRHWKAGHRQECKVMTMFQQQEAAEIPAKKDLSNYETALLESLNSEIAIAGRSALRLGRSDSLGADHFIALHVTYEAPQTPVETSDIVAVRKLFTLTKAEVMADKEAPEFLRMQLLTCRYMAEQGNLKTAFFVIFCDSDLLDKVNNFQVGKFTTREEFGGYDLRAINPHWTQFIANCFTREKYPEGDAEQSSVFQMEDFELYETPENVEAYRLKLDIGLQTAKKALTGIDEKALWAEFKERAKDEGQEAALEWIKGRFVSFLKPQ